jgi:raffinose/stachyose/melibiose transport system permease protein
MLQGARHTNKRFGPSSYTRLAEALPFLLPALIIFGAFTLYPLVDTIRLSFMEWNGFSGSPVTFVGFDNYDYVFTKDPVFWTAAKNSIIWVMLSLLIPTTGGLLLALLLNQPVPGRNIFRTIYYLPAVLAPIAVATMWRWMYNPYFGVVNYLLKTLGLESLKQPWLSDPDIAIFSVFAASAWVVTGLNMVLFLAGLQNVPPELKEAARVDGAGQLNVFRHVTIPSLRPTLIIVIAFTIINSLKVFDLIVGMTNGAPAQSTQVLALWSYTQSFGNHAFGIGNAIGTVLLGLTLIIVIPYLVWSLRETGE